MRLFYVKPDFQKNKKLCIIKPHAQHTLFSNQSIKSTPIAGENNKTQLLLNQQNTTAMAGLVHGSIDMDAMERKFLTTNLAKEDVNDERDQDSGDENDTGDPDLGHDYDPVVEAIAAAQPKDDKSMLTMNRSKGGNTGPKGVKADYEEWRKHQESQREREAAEREALLQCLASGAISTTPSVSYSAMEAQRVLDKSMSHMRQGAEADEDDLLDELEDDEEAFMEAYRQKRRKEIQNHAKLPVYGKVTTVTAFDFVDRLESSDPGVSIVVHMYEDDIRACKALDTSLESLAREYQHTDFLRLCKDDTPTGLQSSSLPSLLVYRAGELVHTVMAVVDKIGAKCAKHDVEDLLKSFL